MSPSEVYATRADVVQLIHGQLIIARDQERFARRFKDLVERGTPEKWQARQAALKELLEKLGEWQTEEPDDVR
jgi:hypothetical protein